MAPPFFSALLIFNIITELLGWTVKHKKLMVLPSREDLFSIPLQNLLCAIATVLYWCNCIRGQWKGQVGINEMSIF